MIGLDTNILVRYIAQDDAAQSLLATRIIEDRLTEDDPGYISLVTMTETVWVLGRSYSLTGGEIAAIVEHILQTDVLFVQNEPEVFTAMVALKTGAASFSDALIGALGTRAGCAATLTFDKKAARSRDFRLVME